MFDGVLARGPQLRHQAEQVDVERAELKRSIGEGPNPVRIGEPPFAELGAAIDAALVRHAVEIRELLVAYGVPLRRLKAEGRG